MLIKMLTNTKTFEEYRRNMKKRYGYFICLLIFGIILLGSGLAFEQLKTIEDQNSGFISGAGTGIILASLVLIVKHWRLMKNEKELREEWVKENDERNREITIRSVSAAAAGTFVIIYIALIVSFFLNPVVFKTLILVFFTAFLTLIAARKYYERKL